MPTLYYPGGAKNVIINPAVLFSRTANPSWWLAGGLIPAANVLGAYQGVGVASLAESKVNKAIPGTRDLVAVTGDPTWGATTGWSFNGSSQLLNTQTNPTTSFSSIVRFANVTTTTPIMGYIHTLARRWWATPQFTGNVFNWGNGNSNLSEAAGSGIASGTAALVSGTKAYKNGVDTGLAFSAWSGTATSGVRLGGSINENGGAITYTAGDVIAAAFYNINLSAAQVAALHTAIAAL